MRGGIAAHRSPAGHGQPCAGLAGAPVTPRAAPVLPGQGSCVARGAAVLLALGLAWSWEMCLSAPAQGDPSPKAETGIRAARVAGLGPTGQEAAVLLL